MLLLAWKHDTNNFHSSNFKRIFFCKLNSVFLLAKERTFIFFCFHEVPMLHSHSLEAVAQMCSVKKVFLEI